MNIDSGNRAAGYVWPLSIIFVMQCVITMAIYALPVIMPVAAMDLGVAPQSVGFLVAAIYAVSTATGLLSQALIARFGPTGLFRLLLAITAISVLVLIGVPHIGVWLSVAILGLASGPMNPAGSYVLAKVVPVHRRAFIFSLKQCATPAGGMLAGVVLPPLMLAYGWRPAMAVIPVAAALLLLLAPARRLGQRAIDAPPASFSFKATAASLAIVWREPSVRNLTVATVCLATAQMALATYLVVYLWQVVGLSEAAAGLVFAALHFFGIGARIVLGFCADRFTSAKWILVGLCAVLAACLFAIGSFASGWPLAVIYIVVAGAGATGNGWVGLYYAELARLAPPTRIAEITGASQFFTYIGLVLGPIAFGALLLLSGSYQFVFFAFAALLVVATVLLTLGDIATPVADKD